MNTDDDVFKSSLLAEIDGTTSTTTKRADDENTGQVAALGFALCSCFLDVVDQKTLVLVRLDAWQKRVLAVSKLVGPGHDGESSASKTSMLESISDVNNIVTTALTYVAESGDSSSVLYKAVSLVSPRNCLAVFLPSSRNSRSSNVPLPRGKRLNTFCHPP